MMLPPMAMESSDNKTLMMIDDDRGRRRTSLMTDKIRAGKDAVS